MYPLKGSNIIARRSYSKLEDVLPIILIWALKIRESLVNRGRFRLLLFARSRYFPYYGTAQLRYHESIYPRLYGISRPLKAYLSQHYRQIDFDYPIEA